MAEPLFVPPGYHPPFAVISASDHGGWIIIATALGLAMAMISTLIRIYVKTISRQYTGMDDYLLAAATVITFTLESIILAACSRGLGQNIDLIPTTNLRRIEKAFYASQLLAVLALGLCKCSIASFIKRLTPQSSFHRTIYSIQVAVVSWMIGAVLAFALQCDLNLPWRFTAGSCSGIYTRVLIIGVLDILLEVALFAAVIQLVSSLQAAYSKKIMVLFAFSLRLPLVGFTAARIKTFDQSNIDDFAISEALYIIWTVTELNYSLISTTLPILRPFISSLATFYGAMPPSEYGSLSGSRSNTIPLSTFRSRPTADIAKVSHRSHGSRSSAPDPIRSSSFTTPLNGAQASAHVQSGPSHDPNFSSHSVVSNSSQRMFIRVDTDIAVEEELRFDMHR